MIDARTFGALVRSKRRELKLTQAQLAQKVPCQVQTVYRVESGAVSNPTLRIVEGLATALGMSTDALLGRQTSRISNP